MKKGALIGIVVIGIVATAGITGIFLLNLQPHEATQEDDPRWKNVKQFVNETHGSFTTYQVQGNYVFLTSGLNLMVLNITDPTNITKLDEINIPKMIYQSALDGNYFYGITSEDYMFIIDITDPFNMEIVKVIFLEGYLRNLLIDTTRHILYVENDIYGFWDADYIINIYDITNPIAPVKRDSLTFNVQMQIFYLGTKLYIYNTNIDELGVYDVSNPSNVVKTATINLPFEPRKIVINPNGNLLYMVGYMGTELLVLDITNPASPVSRDTISTGTSVDEMIVYQHGEDVKVCVNSNQLWIINVTDPDNLIEEINVYKTDLWGRGTITYDGSDFFLMTIGSYAFYIYNITSPQISTPLVDKFNVYFNYVQNVEISGDELYMAADGHLFVINKTDPSSLEILSNTTETGNDILIEGNYAFVAQGSNIAMLDISDPMDVTWVKDLMGGKDFFIDDLKLYSMHLTDELYIYDISALPATPLLGQHKNLMQYEYVFSIAAKGDIVYEAGSKLKILNVSTPSAIFEVKNMSYCNEIAIYNDFLFVGSSDNISVYNISDQINPIMFDSIDYNNYSYYDINDIHVYNNLIFLATDKFLEIIDYSNPYDLKRVGYYLTEGLLEDVVYDNTNGLIYSAAYATGLLTFEFDTDEDELYSLEERDNFCSILTNDTDDDHMPDGWEVNYGLFPSIDDAYNDKDLDLLLNVYEYFNGTDPTDNDTDNDEVSDGLEVALGRNPLGPEGRDIPGAGVQWYVLVIIVTSAAIAKKKYQRK